ncbi:Hypothetical_protein [Hexamita inflata]|uniref:Hypothetical_protein n=1 Tax=Hexamita inflata TaxID=28002 RepID=A0ABP1KZM3_9EUKA
MQRQHNNTQLPYSTKSCYQQKDLQTKLHQPERANGESVRRCDNAVRDIWLERNVVGFLGIIGLERKCDDQRKQGDQYRRNLRCDVFLIIHVRTNTYSFYTRATDALVPIIPVYRRIIVYFSLAHVPCLQIFIQFFYYFQ